MRVVEISQLEKYRRRRQTRKSLKKVMVVVLAISFTLSLYTAFVLARPLPVVKATEAAVLLPLASLVPLPWPKVGTAAMGAVGFELLDNHDGDKQLPSASVIKILTALMVLEKYPLTSGEQGPVIRITAVDTDGYHNFVSQGGSVFPVNVGQEITEYQALQAMLLPSANNIADTLARWAYGSLEAYQQAANAKATTLGLKNTHIADASGFVPQTVSSANDLVRLGLKAMEHPVIVDIVSQPEAVLPGGHLVRNVNTLLGSNGIIGIKTGTSDEAGGCFLFAAKRVVAGQSIIVIGSIMAEPNRTTALSDALPLADAALNGFEQVTVIKKGQILNSYNLAWQDKVNMIAKNAVSGVTWKARPPTVDVDHPILFERGPALAVVPSAKVHFGSNTDSTELVLDKSVTTPSNTWKLLHPLR